MSKPPIESKEQFSVKSFDELNLMSTDQLSDYSKDLRNNKSTFTPQVYEANTKLVDIAVDGNKEKNNDERLLSLALHEKMNDNASAMTKFMTRYARTIGGLSATAGGLAAMLMVIDSMGSARFHIPGTPLMEYASYLVPALATTVVGSALYIKATEYYDAALKFAPKILDSPHAALNVFMDGIMGRSTNDQKLALKEVIKGTDMEQQFKQLDIFKDNPASLSEPAKKPDYTHNSLG